jgi:hypothetical protein
VLWIRFKTICFVSESAVDHQNVPDTVLCPIQCCGASGVATFCWSRSRSQSFFDPAPEPSIEILIKCYKNPKFFIQKLEVESKNHNLDAVYFTEPFDDHLCLQTRKFIETKKIVEFFLII